MLKVLTKTIITALLLMSLSGQTGHARVVKNYQYDGKLPFVEMMLNMMVVMGVLDRIPANGLYGGYGSSSPWSSRTGPYSSALARRGLSPGSSLYNNPLLSSPWLRSPWSSTALNNSPYDSPWGNAGWGVIPLDDHSPWSSSDLSGWVKEPWETSVWNSKAENSTQNLPSNVNNNVRQNNRQHNQAPPAKLKQAGQPKAKAFTRPSNGPVNRQPKDKIRQKPCITDFCGLKKPNLNGLWVTQNGEMLGVKNKRFLWSDGNSRYLSGQIIIQNEYLLARVDDSGKLMRYKYKLAGNYLLTLQPDGVVREFKRVNRNR